MTTSYSDYIKRAADWYIEHGFRIFPVHNELKTPLVEGGFYSATKDSARITEWMERYPNMGLGVPTGLTNGVFVLDVDERSGGFTSLQKLVEANGPLPSTPMALTQNDGIHYYFSYPSDQLPSTKLMAGIDIKSDGGYVVAPPTTRRDGRGYRWQPGATLSSPLAPAPPWLLDLIRKEKRSQEENWVPESLVYPEGMRENILIKFVGALIRKGASEEAITAFVKAENLARCKPPLSSGEVESFVARLTDRYRPDPLAVLGVEPSSIFPRDMGKLEDLSDLDDPNVGRIDEQIEGIVGKGGVTILAAAWKSGKTLVTYRLIIDALQGRPVFGIYPTAKPLKVLMLQYEMPVHEDKRRLRRLAVGAGIRPADLSNTKCYGHINRPRRNLASAEMCEDLRRYILAEEYDLVVVDSLTAAFAPHDLNDNSLARHLFTQAFGAITSRGVSVIVLHHKRKKVNTPGMADDGKSSVLGAQAWAAAADRTFGLENVPRLPGMAPNEFQVRLEVLGSWTPTDAHDLVLTIRDEGEGTVVETTEAVANEVPSKIEDAARDLADFVAEKRTAPLPEINDYLKSLNHSRRAREHGRVLALSRNWVVEVSQEFGKVMVLGRGKGWFP